jgi:hypothetical protein
MKWSKEYFIYLQYQEKQVLLVAHLSASLELAGNRDTNIDELDSERSEFTYRIVLLSPCLSRTFGIKLSYT